MITNNLKTNWSAECLLTANHALESRYRQQASACVALQIARNYRLLASHESHPLKNTLWKALSERWMLSYQLRRTPSTTPIYPIYGEE